jgi:hypothetical protein
MTDNITVTNTIQNVTVANQQPNVTISQVGVQGPAGSTLIFYTHNQATASATWTINHNLNGNPTAVVFDSGGTQCEGSFSYPTLNQMVITFTAAFSGTAYII